MAIAAGAAILPKPVAARSLIADLVGRAGSAAVHRPRRRRQHPVPLEPGAGPGRRPADLRVPGDGGQRQRRAGRDDRGDGRRATCRSSSPSTRDRSCSAATPAAAASRSEMVRQLQALGHEVEHVLLFDSVPATPPSGCPSRLHRSANLVDNLRTAASPPSHRGTRPTRSPATCRKRPCLPVQPTSVPNHRRRRLGARMGPRRRLRRPVRPLHRGGRALPTSARTTST